VRGDFSCARRKLKSLRGVSFGQVSGSFYCFGNQLTTLEGAPQTVGGGFSCTSNQLTSLIGAPQTVDGHFDCSGNENSLTSLEGAPLTVGGWFICPWFQIKPDEWNFEVLLKILTGESPQAKKLTSSAKKLMKTLPWLQPDWWNSELQRDPGKTINLLASWWKDMPEDMKSKIKIPPGYEDEFGLFSGFDELGLF